MVRSIATFLILAMMATPMLAQDDRLDDLSFDEEPLQDEAVPYFAVGLGPVLNVAFPNVDALNTKAADMGLDEMSTPVIQWGAEIFTAIGLIPNVRAGFSWVSGTSRNSKDNVDLGQGASGTRSMEYNLSNRTIHVDYAIVPAKGLAILPGVGLGFGTQTTLELPEHHGRYLGELRRCTQHLLGTGAQYPDARPASEHRVRLYPVHRSPCRGGLQLAVQRQRLERQPRRHRERSSGRPEHERLQRSDRSVRRPLQLIRGLVAQRLEQRTHNPLAAGSNPAGPTM